MSSDAQRSRFGPVMRSDGNVSPLELFFDLVFVLALTQCTALMADDPTWHGLAQGMLVLGVMWWAWVGYSWLTSVVDPEEGAVRVALLAAMAGLLIVSLCIPRAFDELGLLFAGAYFVVRAAQVVLLYIAGREHDDMRRSVIYGIGISTLIGTGLLVGAAFTDGVLQGALWALALTLDMAGPALSGVEGWRLVPGHFAERHGLIVIIALGESIVAIGVGASYGVDAGVVAAGVLGVAVAGALWWLYFDVVALVAERRLASAKPGREQNSIARDSFSFLHLPMIAGIILMALGFKKSLEHTDDPLKLIPAVALCGGIAIYLLAHVAFRWRNVHRLSAQRVIAAVAFLALIPVVHAIPALVSLAITAALLAALIVYETLRFAELRDRLRHGSPHHAG
ncbi:low temperature requirement protein A [Thermoleophilia bacterium SCSIO 60948]|nr:low temperature requirement protein A [Thermoleophilia bacterium SCSIO 60948]